MKLKMMLWMLPLTLACGCNRNPSTTDAADNGTTTTAEADRLARDRAAAEEADRLARERATADADRQAHERAMAEEEARAREQQSATPVAPPLPPASDAETPSAADLALEQSVSAALMNDATLSEDAKKITATVKDGVVTLKGTVASEDERKSVETAVRAVQNVRDVVVTDLEVRP